MLTRLRTIFNPTLQWIAAWGITPHDSDDLRRRKTIINFATVFVSFVFITGIGPFYLVFNEPLTAAIYIFVGVFFSINFMLVKRLWPSYNQLVFVLSAMVLPLHLVTHVMLGGFVESAGIVLWGLAHPVMSNLVIHGPRSAWRWTIPFFLNLLLAAALTPFLTPTTHIPRTVMVFAFAINVGTLSCTATILLTYFVSQLEAMYGLLRGEQEKTETLLLNILPKEIAAILKNESRVIADHYENASILFADVVNFTPMSAQMTPTELVELLNEVFTYFDGLAERHGLEKIKTIGDCYMVASGLPRPRPDHAQALVRMALEMQTFVQSHTFHARQLAFRIGINSGPVVAGVIGRKKFIYDLWGDAVNTASRMESHGQGGTIQITRATYALVQADFICEARGTVAVKGKGDMEVWRVIAPQP